MRREAVIAIWCEMYILVNSVFVETCIPSWIMFCVETHSRNDEFVFAFHQRKSGLDLHEEKSC